MDIYQIKEGYRYNSDTMFLYDFISKNRLKGEVLDVGAGCGVLGMLLKRDFININLSLLEIQELNLKLIRKNLAINSLNCDIIHVDFSNFKDEKRFDFIVSNPPFYHDGVKESENSHKNISRYSRNLNLKILIKTASSHLKPHGVLSFCYDSKQIKEICVLLEEFKFALTRVQFIYPKRGKNASLVLIEAKKSSKSMCKVTEPIYVFSGEKYTKEAEEIFKKANLKSLDM